MWLPDEIEELHPDDQGAVCDDCGQAPAAVYDASDGRYLCDGCLRASIGAMLVLCAAIQGSEADNDT
jgi:hypothetical protein